MGKVTELETLKTTTYARPDIRLLSRITWCEIILIAMEEGIPVTVITDGEETTIKVECGTNLRDVLLERGFPVYGTLSRYANCGGRGLCSTCTVEVDPAPEPTHWHDAAAVRFGYPRLSCCITVEESLTVRLLDKHVWGQVFPRQLSPD